MFFRKIKNCLSQELKKEQKVFVAYSAMTKLLSHEGPFDSDEYFDNKITSGSKLSYLQNKLLTSKNDFVSETERILGAKITAAERKEYAEEFKALILSTDNSGAVLKNLKRPLHSFLAALCYTGSVKSLELFVKKYPQAIKQLPTNEFNSLCAIASINHLYKFMSYLCQQGRSIDEYAILNDNNCVWNLLMTPLIAAYYHTLYQPPYNEGIREKLAPAKEMIELLLAHGADPRKEYIVDDYSDEEILGKLKAGHGYTIQEECNEILAKMRKELPPQEIATSAYRDFKDFLDYIVSLQPKAAEEKTPSFRR
jgi:hypothetical protein